MRLRPTWPERLATPFGKASLRECSSSRGVSIACAASTKTLPEATPSLPSQRLKRIAVTRPSVPTSTLVAVVCAWTSAPFFSATDTCTVASYFAPIGQIGMQLALPQQAGRPLPLTELRACGVARSSYSVPVGPAHRPCPRTSAGWPASGSRQSVANRAARRNRPRPRSRARPRRRTARAHRN